MAGQCKLLVKMEHEERVQLGLGGISPYLCPWERASKLADERRTIVGMQFLQKLRRKKNERFAIIDADPVPAGFDSYAGSSMTHARSGTSKSLPIPIALIIKNKLLRPYQNR
jgi:hypothetical protein